MLSDQRALDAWRRLPEATLQRGARVLPLVAANLERLDPGRAASLRRLIRITWAENQRVLDAAAPVLRRLDGAGVSLLLLKGIALATAVYPSVALRPIGDVDVLVGPETLATARATLAAMGFEEVSPMPEGAEPHLHSFAYRRGDGFELDLHAYSLMECCQPGADAPLRARARRVAVEGVEALVPALEDHLVLACVHGLRWSSKPAIHWVADAMKILERAAAAGGLAWPIVVEAARERSVTVPLRRALRLLRDELGAAIPDSALGALRSPRPPLRERLEASARMRPPSLARGLLIHWCTLARAQRSTPAVLRLAAFPGYLRNVWGLPSLWSLPGTTARKSAARLGTRSRER